MLQIDCHAYSNRLFSVHPGEKTAFSLITMIICLASPSAAASLATVLLMAGITLFRAGIPWRPYLRLMSVPVLFLVLGAAAVAVSFSGGAEGHLAGIALNWVSIGVTSRDLSVAAGLFFKSLGATSCLFFLSLTTPMVEIVSVLRKAGAPALMVELVALVYRFIFVLAETAESIYTSQSSRLGYRNFRTSYQSLGRLAANLFIRAYQRSQALFTALSARCYTGDLRVLESDYKVSIKNVISIIVLDLLLIALSLFDYVIRIRG